MRNVKVVVLVTVVGALSASSASSALAANEANTPNASQVCKSLRSQMGTTSFNATYGTNKNKKNAFGKCVSAQTKLIHKQVKAAKKTCKAEQAANRTAFDLKYGTNKNKKNAYGKCVSAQASAAVNAQNAVLVNAAKQCKAERAANPAAFKLKYGTNKNKKNAYGKCVSKTAKA